MQTRSRSNSNQFVQVIFIVCLMGIIAWLATWQETPPMQLSSEQDIELHQTPWSEEHLIIPVSAPYQYYAHPEHTRAM